MVLRAETELRLEPGSGQFSPLLEFHPLSGRPDALLATRQLLLVRQQDLEVLDDELASIETDQPHEFLHILFTDFKQSGCVLSGQVADVELVQVQVQTDNPEPVTGDGELKDALVVSNEAQVFPDHFSLHGCLIHHLQRSRELKNLKDGLVILPL